VRLLASLVVTEADDEPDSATMAAEVYRSQVAAIVDGRESTRPYPPDAPQLTIVGHHRPRSLDELAPAELVQLHAAVYEDRSPPLSEALGPDGFGVEAAQVVDENGVLRYRLYGWSGVGYLFPPDGLDVVAFGVQHDLEHWSRDQRDVFAAMDRALRVGGHGFTTSLKFCWDDDTCWDEIPEDAPPRSRGSAPWLLGMFTRAAQVPVA
jgi:hypothetical protein